MKKYIFPILLILLFFGKTQNIFAKDGVFTVDNIIIKGKISQGNYKNKYIEIGFRKAFEKLINNILKSEDQKKILSTDSTAIKSLVQSFRIIEEKIVDENYITELEVSFKKTLISNFFLKKGISYSASQKLETLIYPIMILNSELQVFSGNKFFEEWNDFKEFQDVSFILPVENLDDLDFIKRHKNDLEEIDLSRLVDNYAIKNSAILILRYDKALLDVFFKTNFKNVKRLKKVEIKVKNLGDKKVRQETISKLKFMVHDLWKEQNLVDVSTPSYLTINVKISKPGNLEKIMGKITQINLIENYNVKELDQNYAKIQIKYLGKIKALESLFLENGFILSIKDNEWNLTFKG